jgi:hypothetical protein
VLLSSSYGANRKIPENPIARSDVAEFDPRVYEKIPKKMDIGASSMTIDVAEAWRDARLTEIKAQRKVVEIMMDRTEKILDTSTAKDAKKSRSKHEGMIADAKAAMEAMKRTQHAFSASSDIDETSVDSGILTDADGATMHIMPALGAVKFRRHEEAAAVSINTAPGKRRVLSVTYGNRLEVIGSIEVIDSTTYEQARDMVQPLIRDYLTSSSRAQLKDVQVLKKQLIGYTFLDVQGKPVTGNVAHIRTVWSELGIFGGYLDVQPANTIDLSDSSQHSNPSVEASDLAIYKAKMGVSTRSDIVLPYGNDEDDDELDVDGDGDTVRDVNAYD